ncbi:MAG: DUF2905 domain-containing protein [Candidatus Omnitrophica bacterium]|nr:DUF2905 domain-containing protein [Candidatus Omnitrophota bacterium]
MFQITGKLLIITGIVLIIAGVLFYFGKLSWLGRLPGDIAIKRENFSFYFPLTSCVIVSAILSICFYFFSRK